MAPRPETPDLFAAAPLPVAHLDDRQRLACLRLIRSENVGPATFRSLINHYGGASEALAALPELSASGGKRRIRICPEADAIAELEAASRIPAKPIFNIEPGFPAPLAFLDYAPPMLYARGRTELLNKPAIAIVGSRLASAAGIKVTRLIASEIGTAGFAIISGLAKGIDGAAHTASLETGTIAVLAGGIDNLYPPEHADLYDQIATDGCLVSERPPGFEPKGRDFPRRNRIISGISRAVLVIEAAKRSGSLITARMALEQGRDVLAVPGHPLDPRAEGTNDLIKNGASLITSGKDVVEMCANHLSPPDQPAPHLQEQPVSPHADHGRQRPIETSTPNLGRGDVGSDIREKVVSALGPAPINVDELCRVASLPIQSVQIVLLELALAGRIEQHGSQLVSLRTPDVR